MRRLPLALLGLMVLTASYAEDEKTAPPAGVVLVSVTKAVQQSVKTTITGYGAIMPDSDSLVSVSTPKAGQVAQILVRPGQTVTKGMALVAFGTDPNAQAGFKKADSALLFATGELERTRALLAQHLVTNSQMAAAEQAVRDAQAQLDAERSLGTGKMMEILPAPFDGYVDSLLVVLGDRIQPGAPIVRLGRGAGIKAMTEIEAADAEDVQLDQEVEVTPMLGKAAALIGKVIGVAGMLNPVTRLVDVTVALPAAGAGRPGTPVRTAIVTAEHAGLVVPRQAVLEDEDGAYLFQVRQDKAVRVAVETGVETDELTEISGKFFMQDLPVVVLGNYELADGATVQLAKPTNGAEK